MAGGESPWTVTNGDRAWMSEETPDDQVRAKRPRQPFSLLHHWVFLSGVSPTAQALFVHLSMHLNSGRADCHVWPGKAALARRLGFGKEQSIDRYMRELVDLGAVEVEAQKSQGGMRTRNIYLIIEEAPEGYGGARSQAEWYAANRGTAAPVDPVDNSESPGIPVQRAGGVRGTASPADPVDNRKSPGEHVHPHSGVRTPPQGLPVHPHRGAEVDLDSKKTKDLPNQTSRVCVDAREATLQDQIQVGQSKNFDKEETPKTPNPGPVTIALGIVEKLRAPQQGWTRDDRAQLARGVEGKLHAGWPPAHVLAILMANAETILTVGAYHHRLGKLTGAATEAGYTPRPTQAPHSPSSARPRTPEVPRCALHREQLAHNCPCCRSELIGRPDPIPENETPGVPLPSSSGLARRCPHDRVVVRGRCPECNGLPVIPAADARNPLRRSAWPRELRTSPGGTSGMDAALKLVSGA